MGEVLLFMSYLRLHTIGVFLTRPTVIFGSMSLQVVWGKSVTKYRFRSDLLHFMIKNYTGSIQDLEIL